MRALSLFIGSSAARAARPPRLPRGAGWSIITALSPYPATPHAVPMPFRDQLSAVLRGEAAADLGPEERVQLESLAAEALEAGQAAALRDESAGRLRQPGASLAVEYLLAAACALNGEIERAHQTLLALGDKLAAAKRWEALAAVAERALGLEETHAAARLLVRAHEGLGKDPARIEAIEHAWAIAPDDLELGLLLTVRLGEAG